MSLRHHEIAEADHRILNPFTDDKLRLLGEVAGVGPGTRVLDLACGKGEMLGRYLVMIQVQRQDFNGRVLTIRHDDLRAVACILGVEIDEAIDRLADLGLTHLNPVS